jgi:hypothetical protein
MKKIILVLFLFFIQNSYSQINLKDLGKKSYNEVLSSESISPCEITEKKTLTYCVENGSKISYIFNNQILSAIITMTAFPSQYSAEKELENEISKTKKSLGVEPRISNGNTIFNTLESPIMVSFSVNYVNQTYFLVHYIGKK